MNASPPSTNLNTRLLKRTGGFHIVFVLAISQLIVTPLGIALAALLIALNAGLAGPQLVQLAVFTALTMLVRNGFLLVFTHLTNRTVTSRLQKWAKNQPLESGGKEEALAWKQVTSLPWRYIAVAFTSLMVFTLPLSAAYLSVALKGSSDQVFYLVFAGITSGLTNALFEVLLIEYALSNARRILIPQGFESQTSGVRGIRLLTKLIITIFALILIAVLNVAPIGYHQTVTVLYEEIGSTKVLADLQTQSIIVGVFSLLVGFGIAVVITNSISRPVRQMINTFKQIEQGDLKQRVPVIATDEVGELGVHFNHMVARLEELQTGLENRVAERTSELTRKTAQLQAATQVAREAATLQDINVLLSRTAALISDRFGFYHTGIFLLDDAGQYAVLKAASSEGGQRMLARGHRLKVGQQGVVGAAAYENRPHLAMDVEADKEFIVNPDLPTTRSEAAVPLTASGRVIGVLDIQSTETDVFTQEDIEIIQTLADQIGLAIQNARLLTESQNALQRLEAASTENVRKVWQEMTRGGKQAFRYTSVGLATWTPIETELSAVEKETDRLSIPINLRGQHIGNILMQRKAGNAWSEADRSLASEVASQVGLALENARLLQNAQHLASREQQISTISTQIQLSTDLETVLQNTVRELGLALGAPNTFIQIGLNSPEGKEKNADS
jgi:GAF domain-containing protein/HAMP domain-containing protein